MIKEWRMESVLFLAGGALMSMGLGMGWAGSAIPLIIGVRMFRVERQRGTWSYWLTKPISRTELIFSKWGAGVIGLAMMAGASQLIRVGVHEWLPKLGWYSSLMIIVAQPWKAVPWNLAFWMFLMFSVGLCAVVQPGTRRRSEYLYAYLYYLVILGIQTEWYKIGSFVTHSEWALRGIAVLGLGILLAGFPGWMERFELRSQEG
jgi:ABC-type transport system involved in multi-copper enzyme maturation permease subunit